ncbi:peptidase [Aestuariirhabdus litorea]|uniref:Peptidase n=1 Tax=Aestuariirhabdus litorea TaxID=2528527 RepID=A0A3P3VML3_9GAMM|nr:peptidase [Aestuariirhabdus litorea]RRJ84002.1 peptidase [Aestuariirhabdus litorea]RWW97222.1 peptidase [Endozoicomonadaceae bacterium GTF-13]
MTYCVAISVNDGIIFTSDSRTNAGVDQISTYSKMHRFGIDGQRQLVIMSAGNLATTQGVIKRVRADIKNNEPVNLMNVADLEEAADYLGEISVAQQKKHDIEGSTVNHEASFIVGGQIGDKTPAIIMIYPQGNYITSSDTTPYLQIGESKYGKPILDRILTPETSLDTSALCALVSMDSTMRSNLTVGPPIETVIYEKGSLKLNRHYQFQADSAFLRELNKSWDHLLQEAFRNLPPIKWSENWDQSPDESGEASS